MVNWFRNKPDIPGTYIGGGIVDPDIAKILDNSTPVAPCGGTASERRQFLCAAVIVRLNAGEGPKYSARDMVAHAKSLWDHIVKD